MTTQSMIQVEGSGSWSSTPSQASWSAEWSRTDTGISSLHVSSLARFLDLTTRELSRGVGGGRLEALVFLLWPSCKVGSGFSAAGSPSTKWRLQTLESLLGIQRVPFKLFLLIFFAHFNRRSGFFFSVANENNLKGGWQSHTLVPLLQPWSSQVVATHFPSLCPLLGQPMAESHEKNILVASQIDYALLAKIVRMTFPKSNETIAYR